MNKNAVVVDPEVAVRTATVNAAKLKSAKSTQLVMAAHGRETFVFEAGKLTEYEYVLPAEYLEYPDKE